MNQVRLVLLFSLFLAADVLAYAGPTKEKTKNKFFSWFSSYISLDQWDQVGVKKVDMAYAPFSYSP